MAAATLPQALDGAAPAIHGYCDPAFEPVRAAFARNFQDGGELGASVAIEVDGYPVVDLWAGWVDSGWRVLSCASTERVVTVVGRTAVFSHAVHTVTLDGDGTRTETRERESIVFAVGEDGALIAVHEHLAVA